MPQKKRQNFQEVNKKLRTHFCHSKPEGLKI